MATVTTPGSKDPDIQTYNWVCADRDCDMMLCYKSPKSFQTVCILWEAGLSDFHDKELAEATKKINTIIKRLDKSNKDKQRKLSFIKYDDQLMLIWALYGAVGPDDHFKAIKKALKLRA